MALLFGNSSFKRYKPALICWAVFIAIAILFYHKSIFWLPRGIHEWAQADRLALAMQFYDRGFNFFKPATYNISPIDGIVGVEFPIQAYAAALLGLVFGREHISVIFRLLDILMAVTGFYFLFRLVYENTGNYFAALLPGIFLISSPVFAYYAGNYLPDTFSTSLVFVGLYFFFRFYQTKQTASLYYSLLILFLASLIKTTSAIFLLAAIAFVCLWAYFKENALPVKHKLYWLLGSAGSLGIIAVYAVYNKYLNAKYQSGIFMSEPKPVENKEMLLYIKSRFFSDWRFEYFTKFQYAIIYVCFFLFLIFLWQHLRYKLAYAAFILIALCGGIVFFALMGAQLTDHDYYIISAYFPTVILLLLLAIYQLTTVLKSKYILNTILGGISVCLVYFGYKHHLLRQADKYKEFSNYYYYPWMQNGAEIIAKAGVPQNARLLILSNPPPNLALVYFDRVGVVWAISDENKMNGKTIKEKLKADKLQYAVINRPDFEKFLADDVDFRKYLQVIVNNNQFLVLK